jgi:tetratricopeptide (TPR) repeat protein
MWNKMPLVLNLVFTVFLSCASTGNGESGDDLFLEETGDGLSLAEAIEQSAAELTAKLPAGTRVAIVSFDTEHKNLSGYIMDELGGALAEGGLEVADRRNLEIVYKELNFQMSGNASDETAVSIGKFLAAEYVISGQLLKAGGPYRYRLSGIKVETAVLEIPVRLDVRDSRVLRILISDLQSAKITAPAAYSRPAAPPGTAGAFLDRGILFGSRGDFDLAIEDFTEAIKLAPDNAAAYLQRSKALHASVSMVSNLDENFDFIISGTGYSEKTRGVYNRALADASAAIRLAPALAGAYRNRGRLYEDMGENDKAISDFNQAIRLDPNYVRAYIGRGVTYYNKKAYDKAIADYTQAIRLDPDSALAYNNRAITYYNKKDYDRAIADYEKAARLDPKYTEDLAVGYNNRGNAYWGKKDYDKAIADYTQAIRLNPNEAVYTENLALAYNNRGNAYYDKKDYDRAIADYTQAINQGPSASRYNRRGNAYWGKKDYARARADYEQALRLDPNNAIARSNLEKLRNMGY